jgi:hypothetical protein
MNLRAFQVQSGFQLSVSGFYASLNIAIVYLKVLHSASILDVWTVALQKYWIQTHVYFSLIY